MAVLPCGGAGRTRPAQTRETPMLHQFLHLARKILGEVITLAEQGRQPPADQAGMAVLEQKVVRALTALQEVLLGPIDKAARDLGWFEDVVIERHTNCFNAAHELVYWTCRRVSTPVNEGEDEC